MQTKISKNSFDGQSFFIGIDYHKKSWKVTILGEQYEHKTMSQNPSPEILASYMRRNFPGGKYKAVYEAGFSGFESCRKLQQLGVDCIVIHPADVPTSQKEKLQKTDKADSRKLARTLRANEFEAIHIPERDLEADRALVRQRYRLVKDISRTKNRVKSLLFQFGIDIPERFSDSQTRYWSSVFINWIKELPLQEESFKLTISNYIRIGEIQRKELLIVSKQIRSLSQSKPYIRNYNLLLSVPGIGLMTAMTFLTQIGDIRRFNRLDDLCNYIGLVPRMYGSGEKMVVGKMVRRGRKEMKIMLIEASWQAIRKDPALMLKFNELSKKMHKNKAIIRIARKMLSRMRFVLLNKHEYVLSVVN
ncbi:MAG: IS110 family transposase [Tannerellaceae bacterium]|nr:IS110 family transposase [Tannerellaceae bacterium]